VKQMKLHPSVQVAWALANFDACLGGSPRIEPPHFLLAIVKIVDGLFENAVEALEISREDVREIFKVGNECRVLLKMTDDEITAARRNLNRALRGEQDSTIKALHRSAESRYLFNKAIRRASEAGLDELTIRDLLVEILADLPNEFSSMFMNGLGPSLKDEEEWPTYLSDPNNP
jgi:hypothetical protein